MNSYETRELADLDNYRFQISSKEMQIWITLQALE